MTTRAGLFYYLFSTLTCAVDMFHLFTDYVDLCFPRSQSKMRVLYARFETHCHS